MALQQSLQLLQICGTLQSTRFQKVGMEPTDPRLEAE
jgi:hypothetical protein